MQQTSSSGRARAGEVLFLQQVTALSVGILQGLYFLGEM